ncbi:MAG: O-antigen ligase family protein [Candidatus Limnocylindria bacterium]
MIRLLPRVALQLWIVGFIVFFGAEAIHLEPPLRIATQVLYGFPLAAWAVFRLRGPYDRLDMAVLGLLVAYVIVCLFSRDRTESLGTLALATAYATWFLLLRRAAHLRPQIVLAIGTGLALTLAFNAYLQIQEKATWLATVGAAPFEGLLTFPWESVNALPMLVLIAIPFLAWVAPSQIKSVLMFVVGFSTVVVVPLSMGRAGWLGLAVAALLALLLLPSTLQTFAKTRWQIRALGAGVATAAVLGVAVLVGPRAVTAIGESGRLLLWEQGMAMITGSPLIGSGPGTYSWVRLEAAPAAADLVAVRLIHNVPLQTLVDGGLVLGTGLVGLMAVWGLALHRRWRAWRVADRVALACVTGFVAALILDDFSYLPAITASFLAVAAFLVPASDTRALTPARGLAAPALLALAALIALPNVVAVDVARSAAQTGRGAMVDGSYGAARAHFEAATQAHPESGGYWLGLGMAASYDGDKTGAIDAYRRAVAVAPGDPRGYAALAELDTGADASVLLEQAADRTLGDPQYAVRLGLDLMTADRPHEATHAWSRAAALRPDLVTTLPYGNPVTMGAVATEAMITIHNEPHPALRENMENAWDLGLALDTLPADAGPAWRAVDAARHGDHDTARELAEGSVTAAPYVARGYQALAAVAAFSCDPTTVESALRLEALSLGAYEPLSPEPQVRREFVYREASLGPTQPLGVEPLTEPEMWPWSLVPRPTACDG